MYEKFGINKEIENLANETEENIKEVLKKIDENAMINSLKVLNAFQKNQISDMHFGMTTGYGEGDVRKRSNRKDIFRSTRSVKTA